MPPIDFRAYWAGGNRFLVAATLLLCVLAGAIWVGPGATHRRTLQQTLEQERERYERWEAELKSYRPITADDLRAWDARFRDVSAWLPHANDAPSQMAEVARWFEAPSTREFEIQPGDPLDGRESEIEAVMTLRAPDDMRALQVSAVPLEITFKVSYRDLREILRRVQFKEVPVWIDALRIQRAFSALEVRMELVVFVRTGSHA